MSSQLPTTAQTISFDLDGTLINGPFGRVITDLEDDLIDRGIEARGAILRRHTALLDSDVMASYDWQQIVADELAEADTSAPFDLFERLEEYAAAGRTTLLHDRTPQLLSRLRSAGWRVLVLTNGWRPYQEPILRHAGLLELIDGLITSDDVGEPKPSARMFAAARGTAERYVHVGDRLDHDIAGGNAVGARTVLLRTDAPETADADYLDDLARRQRVPADQHPALTGPDLITARLDDLVQHLLRQ
ncbi:HAD family hydrolase [Microlunatus soli]|uniref:Putative hydrolase of the HAD superfamily n=1 Tax=Microlunatus soli TaxID=630515 RepID=A0A1H1QMR0_9ACTN|nr:HAD family hydrolase [Microlunatus soli]SDS24760.1 putative hydrolase of the HAD superfamily [Microlunatus soli]